MNDIPAVPVIEGRRARYPRRSLLTAGFASLLLAGCSPARGPGARPGDDRIPYVLVHGAWHGGWCWRDVAARLASAGHPVLAPTLSGLGERAAMLSTAISLQTHIDDVIAAIELARLGRFILVGHSYGGMVIAGVADLYGDRIAHLVYLDAPVPHDRQSMISCGPPKSARQLAEARSALLALSRDNGLSMAPLSPESFGIPRSHPLYSWVEQRMTPHPLRTWLDPVALVRGGTKGMARSYIHCTAPILPGSSFPFFAELARRDRTWIYHEIRTGHDAMITAPAVLSALLLALA